MNSLRRSLSALALVATLAGGAGVATFFAQPVLAQPSETKMAPEHGGHHGRHMIDPMRFLEGRIAYLKAVLKITPAQEADFNKVADAMRANLQERLSTWKEMRESHVKGPQTAVDRLSRLVQMTQLRAQQEQRLLVAFKPLYQSLSADQQKVADRIAASMAHRVMHGRMMHHGMHHGRW